MNPDNIPKGAGQLETPGDGRPINQPGVYRHEASNAEIIIMPDAKSTGQQDALVRMGFVWVGEAPSRVALVEMQKAQQAKDEENAKKGIMPGITTDPNAPKFNPTASLSVEDANKAVEDATARATAAEAELAALKAEQSQPAAPTAPEAPVAPVAPVVPADTSSESESASEDATEGSEEVSTPSVPADSASSSNSQTNTEGSN